MKSRRKQHIIDSPFQLKFAVTIMLGVFGVSAVMSMVLFTYLRHQARLSVLDAPAGDAGNVALAVVGTGLAFAAVMGLGLGIWSLLVSHRVCGPIYVMEQCLNELLAGRIPTPRPLRRKDEFKPFYRTFQKTIESIKARKRHELTLLTGVVELLTGLEGKDAQTCTEAVQQAARRIEAMRRELADAIGVEPEPVTPALKPESEVSEALT